MSSGDSSSSSSSASPSMLGNLRKYMLQKRRLGKLSSYREDPEKYDEVMIIEDEDVKVIEKDDDVVILEKDEKVIPVEKEQKEKLKEEKEGIDLCSQKETVREEKEGLSSREEIVRKEKSLQKVIQAFPTAEKMFLQDTLIQTDWDAQKAIDKLTKENIICQMKRKLGETQGPVPEPEVEHRPKKVRRKEVEEYEEADDEEDNGEGRYNAKVFDSDDSDEDLPDEVIGDKKEVLEFLSTATLRELRAMTNCSVKKAEAIIEQRPFNGWKDLVKKLQSGKFLGTEILNNAQELLNVRRELRTLLKKCKKMATQMERATAKGENNVQRQPSLIPPEYTLQDYQLAGLNWLIALHHQKLSGILADEMGLGKTIQVIAFFAYLKEHRLSEKRTHLVIVPASTLDNWESEFKRWCPSLQVLRYYGSRDERKLMRVDWAGRLKTQKWIAADVVLTTYSMINTPEEKKMFKVLCMHYGVYDEAHMLKNMTTQRYDTLIKINAEHRILLTGTPLQNNLLELMSLLMFVMPKMFMSLKDHMKPLFAKAPKQGTNGLTPQDSNLPSFEKEQIERAKRIMKPFVLRRLKCNVLKDLPTKTLETVYVPLANSQKDKYDELIKTFKSASKEENSENYMTMIMMLRKMSNHPLLLRYHFKDEDLKELARVLAKDRAYKEDNEEYIFQDLQLNSDFQIYLLAKSMGLSKFYIPPALVCESGKFMKFDELLPALKRDNHRVLVFSQFVIMLDVIEEYLKIREHGYLRLDGSTPVTERQSLIDVFNNDPSVFIILLSTKAGGVGINLTAADTVIIHDVDFNPHNDKQAEDRCHRMGQSRDVSVMRFVSEGTIEEMIYRTAQEKLLLEREINDEEDEDAEEKSSIGLLKQALCQSSGTGARTNHVTQNA